MKNVLNLSVLGLGALCLMGTSSYLLTQREIPAEVSSADVLTGISNSTPDYFSAITKKDTSELKDLIKTNSPLFLSTDTSEFLNLRFNTELCIVEKEGKESYLIKKDGSDMEWSAFNFNNFSIKRNGKYVNYSTSGNPSYITQGTKTYANGFLSEQFDLQIKLDETNKVENNILTLDKEGVYEITIPYTMYITTDNGTSFDQINSETITFTFMLFQHTTYLNSGVNSPRLETRNFQVEPSTNNAFDYNYYYNYGIGEVPYITYDATKYNLKLSKNFNFEEEEVVIAYDNSLGKEAFEEKYNQYSSMFELSFNETTNSATIVFKNLGDYTLDFDLVYTTETYETYALPHDINNQKVYMFGYQSTYTTYDTQTKTNNYPEFKSFDKTTIKESADVTRYLENPSSPITSDSCTLNSAITPVSTNQSPVKFKEYANAKEGKLYKVNSINDTTLNLSSNPTSINFTKNISTPGTYLAVFKYTFDNYILEGLTNSSKEFYQVFYFQVTNDNPSLQVKCGDEVQRPQELYSGEYTNKNVYIQDISKKNEFDSDVIVVLERTDYENNNAKTRKILNTNNFKLVDGYYEITENGNYLIQIYYGREGLSGEPIERRFNIDKMDITNISAFGVQSSGSNSYYKATSEIFEVTNQPLIFAWEEKKLSGASTYAYYRYFPIKATSNLSSASDLSILLNQFINNQNSIPVDYSLDLSGSSAWISYPNAKSVSSSDSIASHYVKKASGLYFLEVFDKAGNKTVKVYLLDDTAPNFVIDEPDNLGIHKYSILNGNTTISRDATIYWSKNKVIKLQSYTSDNNFFKDAKNEETQLLENAYDTFKQKYIKNLTGLSGEFAGNYLSIEINPEILFQDLTSANYEFKNDINRFEINSSYSLYYIEKDGVFEYYFSTTTGEYIKIDDPSAKDAIKNGERFYGSELTGLTKYEGNPDGKGYNSIYIQEGSYTFLIRDNSNTRGTSLSKKDMYLNFPSGYQVINLTSDASLLSIGILNEDGKIEPLSQASYAAKESEVDEKKYKDMYYNPTSVNKVFKLSFVPRIVYGDKVTQVEKVEIAFYPFVNKFTSKLNTLTSKTEFTYYRTLSSTPEFSYNAYEFKGEESTDEITIDLNPFDNATKEGKYVITRTYMTGEGYIINEYDFYERTLTLIVDRENVISEPQVVNAKSTTYSYDDGKKHIFTVVGSTLISSIPLHTDDKIYYIKATLEDGSTKTIENVPSTEINYKYYYSFDKEILSIKLYNKNNEEQKLKSETETIIQSSQSIVGNGILVSVFADSGNSVEFPGFDSDNDDMSLNSGYSFYTTAQSFGSYDNTDNENRLDRSPNAVFETNKIPFKIYIPEYKYSTTKDFKNTTDSSSIFYTDMPINYYRLTANVYKDTVLIARSDEANENGFLSFKDLNGNQINSFTQTGKYSVIITQANDAILNETSFKNRYVFSFIVKESTPDFTIYGADGKVLNGPNETSLYTNKSEIEIKWTDSDSNLISNIDKSNIEVKYNSENITLNVDEIPNDAFSYAYSPISLLNSLKIDLGKLGIYSNGENISISMRLEGYTEFKNAYPNDEENPYTPVTKTISVDTTNFFEDNSPEGLKIYDSTTKELFSKIGNIDYNLNHDSLRKYYDANGSETTDSEKTSYSATVNEGFYRYYSYAVDNDFFNYLQEKAKTNRLNNPTEITSIYYREIENIYTAEFEETSYENFFSSDPAFGNVDEYFKGNTGNYYEIIESDYAGNLNIYLVYLVVNNDEAIKTNVEALSISDEEVKTNKYNLYGKNELKINGISFQNDKWNFIKVDNGDSTMRLVTSPWLTGGMVKNLSTGEEINIQSILNDSKPNRKTVLSISDRTNNTYYNVFVGKSNTSSLEVNNLNEEEGLQIKLPSTDIVTGLTLRTFPIGIKIEQKEDAKSDYKIIGNYINDPNKNLNRANYSYQTAWNILSDSKISFEYNTTQDLLIVKFIDMPLLNSKIKYTITDNFGKETSLIHIVGTTFTDGIEYTGNLYQSYDESGNLYYRTSNSFTYIFNPQVYSVEVYLDGNPLNDQNNDYYTITQNGNESTKYTFKYNGQIDKKFEIQVYDKKDELEDSNKSLVKSVYVHLYNMLPTINGTEKKVRFIDENANLIDKFTPSSKKVEINGIKYSFSNATTFATIVNIKHDASPTEFPYQGFIFKESGTESDFLPFESGYQIKESGVYYILFKYTTNDIFNYEYILYRLEVLDSSTNFFYVTLDGQMIAPQNKYYTKDDGEQYSNYYMVNVAYSQKSRVVIETNQYQKVSIQGLEGGLIYNGDITTAIYKLSNKTGATYPTGVSPYNDYVVITYIPQNSKPANNLTFITQTGEEESLLNNSSKIITINKASAFESLKIKWNSYYGIKQNEILIKAEKDGYSIELPIYYEDDYSYTLLDVSGTYNLQFTDAAGNIQTFGTRNYLEIIFLKDVHFTMIQTIDGQEIETEAIDRGVFNNQVKLRLKNLSKYYPASSVGNGQSMIRVKRNGFDFSEFTFDAGTSTFTFDKVGFYQVYFSATAINGVELREQTYSFTIINPYESRYAFGFSTYNGYRIKEVLKDDGISIKNYEDYKGKDNIFVSYYDENTGAGSWTITIDTGKKLTLGSQETTKFTFSFLIRSALPPINVSAGEGTTTTDVIKISFNAENIYNAVGDCILSFGDTVFHINKDTIQTIGVQSLEIRTAGTYYIQVTTESGNLLYSYKVTKKDPLNGWAIMAIVLGVILVTGITIVVIKLRKRIKVK